MSILIVDDSEEMRALYRAYLKEAGFKSPVIVDSALAAYEKLGIRKDSAPPKAPPIEIILLDVAMPDIDGIEACRYIKSFDLFYDIPVVMISAMEEEEVVALALEAGAVEFVHKPIRKLELIARVRAILRLKREIDSRKLHEEKVMELAKKLAKQNELLKKLSATDSLTGIANRRSFFEHVKEEWKRSIRNKRSLSILMVDVDHFKHFNDTYGHHSGDDCLKLVSSTIHSLLNRPGDLIARYGGEEFIIILPDTHLKGAEIIANAVRSKVEDLAIYHGDIPTGNCVTISIGIASIEPTKENEVSKIIKAADKALYRAKAEGRNRVVTAVEGDIDNGA
ncbi:MAG: diguanylate cyclase [Deltaproteobacteria bacterium]|nr:diguanylate cyclase [Deltaproteobacteria bacterium]